MVPAVARGQTDRPDPDQARRRGLDSDGLGHRVSIGDTTSPMSVRRPERKDTHIEYGIGGILILILVILAIIYFAKRV
jgi:hypothetical protein